MSKMIVLILLVVFFCGCGNNEDAAPKKKLAAEVADIYKDMEVIRTFGLKNIKDPEMKLLFSFYMGKEWMRRASDLAYAPEYLTDERKEYFKKELKEINELNLICFKKVYDNRTQLTGNNRNILSDLYYFTGIVKNRLKENSKPWFEMAVKAYEAQDKVTPTVELRKRIADCYLKLGYSCEFLHEYQEALVYFKKYQALYPSSFNEFNGKEHINRIQQKIKTKNTVNKEK